MGNSQYSSYTKNVNFEDMINLIKNIDMYLLINTLPVEEQSCLILNTISIDKEEIVINNLIKNKKQVQIVVYGKNYADDSVRKKCIQLYTLGFINVYVYMGGIFEWLLLQDIYGNDIFQTTKQEKDLLKVCDIKIGAPLKCLCGLQISACLQTNFGLN